MAHNLNIKNGQAAMMYVGEVPWHELGTRLTKAPKTAEAAIAAAGLDWKVGLKPVYVWEGKHFYEIPDRKGWWGTITMSCRTARYLHSLIR